MNLLSLLVSTEVKYSRLLQGNSEILSTSELTRFHLQDAKGSTQGCLVSGTIKSDYDQGMYTKPSRTSNK